MEKGLKIDSFCFALCIIKNILGEFQGNLKEEQVIRLFRPTFLFVVS